MAYFDVKCKKSVFTKNMLYHLAKLCKVTIDYCEITLRNSVEYWHVQGHGTRDNCDWFVAELQNLAS